MTIDLIREIWDYHYWANRRLFDVAAALGEEAAAREIGAQFSAPSLRGMFAHVSGADRWWLERWKGTPTPTKSPSFAMTRPLGFSTTISSAWLAAIQMLSSSSMISPSAPFTLLTNTSGVPAAPPLTTGIRMTWSLPVLATNIDEPAWLNASPLA